MNVHTIVFKYVTQNLDKLLLLLDKERLNQQEEREFELLTSCLLDGTDLLSALSTKYPRMYLNHTLANKYLQYLSFVLYQCVVRNNQTKRGKTIHKIFVCLRLILLNMLDHILTIIPNEKQFEWLLQDGYVTTQIQKGLDEIDLTSITIFSYELEYKTAHFDRWRKNSTIEQSKQLSKDLYQQTVESISNSIKVLKNLVDEIKKKSSKTIVIKPNLQGIVSNSSFELEVEEDEDKLCFICCSNYANKIMLPCKHSACESCIQRHMELSDECFFCKGKIDELKDRSELGMENDSATTN